MYLLIVERLQPTNVPSARLKPLLNSIQANDFSGAICMLNQLRDDSLVDIRSTLSRCAGRAQNKQKHSARKFVRVRDSAVGFEAKVEGLERLGGLRRGAQVEGV